MLALLARTVHVKVISLPAVLTGIEVVSHTEDTVVHGLIGSHLLKKRRVLDGNELTLVGRAGEVDDTDTAEVALILGRGRDAVDSCLKETAGKALEGLAEVDDDAMGLVYGDCQMTVFGCFRVVTYA